LEAGSIWLPSRVAENAIRGHARGFATYLRGRLKYGLEIAGSEVIQASKPRGLRPLSVLSLEERVCFRALTDCLEKQIGPPARSEQDFENFQIGILAPDVKYVVTADIASFYQLIDHSLLVNEIVGRTGDADLGEAIGEFLRATMQRGFGLPQLYHSSDVLSELAGDLIYRRMLREGFLVTRYNDDFHIGVSEWTDTFRALERLDHHVREAGLTLNESKTLNQKASTYRAYMARPDVIWNEIAQEVHLDVRQIDWSSVNFYEPPIPPLVGQEADELDSEEAPPDAEVRELWESAGERALGVWSAGIGVKSPTLRRRIDRQLVRQGLRILRSIKSRKGLSTCKELLRGERESTPAVAKYLRALIPKHEKYVLKAYANWLDPKTYLSPWQVLWLLEPLLLAKELPDPLATWVQRFTDSAYPDLLRR
jgi:hypothetical protein